MAEESTQAIVIARCWDVTEAHLKDAIKSRRTMAALIELMVGVARPNEGAAKILIVLARLARPSCEWIEGSLRIEVDGTERTTEISVVEDLGGGVRERVFPRYFIPVPFAEIEKSIRTAPRAIEPLVAKTADGKLVLTKAKARQTLKPPSFKLAEDCLRKTLPPTVRKDLKRPPSSPDLPPPAKPPQPQAQAAPPPPAAQPPPLSGITFDMPRAPKFLDFSNFTPEKQPPPPVPKRPKTKP